VASEASGLKSEWSRGWRAVIAGFLGIGAGFSLYPYVSSLFVQQFIKEFGWTRGEISISAFGVIVGAFVGLWVGRLADRYGARRTAIVGTLLYSGMLAAMSRLPSEIGAYYVLYTGMVCVGMATSGLVYTKPVSAWFDTARGMGLAATLTGVSVGAIIAPPLLTDVIAVHGWRAAYLALAGATLLTGLLAAFLVTEPGFDSNRSDRSDAAALSGMTLGEAGTGHRFWAMIVALLLINIAGGGVMHQMALVIRAHGIEPGPTAQLMSLFALMVFVGRLAAGVLLDRVWAPLVWFLTMAPPAVGCFLLLGGEATIALLAIGVALIGLSQGAEGDLIGYMVARYFGVRHFGAINGAMGAAVTGGTALGALLFGISHDRTGSYDFAMTAAGVSFGVAALILFTLGRYPDHQSAAGQSADGRLLETNP
jgi:MFS transporter, OFA family, oxalate/formate antiporter